MNHEIDSLSLKFIQNNYGEFVAVKLDYVDFMLILHAGKSKNTPFFENIIESIDQLRTNEDYEND